MFKDYAHYLFLLLQDDATYSDLSSVLPSIPREEGYLSNFDLKGFPKEV